MAKKISLILGIAFLLVGVIGFVAPHFIGTHLSLAHNLIHLLSGAVAVYFGTAGTLEGARRFCIVSAVVYGLLGIAGFLFGHPDVISAGGMTDQDNKALKVIPGTLELGTADHALHVALAIVFAIGGLISDPRSRVQPKVT